MSAASQTSGNMTNGSFVYPLTSLPLNPSPMVSSSSVVLPNSLSSTYPTSLCAMISSSPFRPPPPPPSKHHIREAPLDCSSASSTSNHKIYPPLKMMPKATFLHPQRNSPRPHHSPGQPILLDNTFPARYPAGIPPTIPSFHPPPPPSSSTTTTTTSLSDFPPHLPSFPYSKTMTYFDRVRPEDMFSMSKMMNSSSSLTSFPSTNFKASSIDMTTTTTTSTSRPIMNMTSETSSSSSTSAVVGSSSNLTSHEIGGGEAMLCIPSEGSVITGSIEKYELIRRLQESLYGAVYHAKGLSSHDGVAVKVLSRKAIKEKELDRVLPETPLAEVFFAPLLRGNGNVLSIREVFEYPACHFVVSDLAEGEDLLELLKHYSVGLPQVLVASFIRQAAQGLLWCHRQGLALQDFSLENCLLFLEREDKEAPLTVRVRVCDPGQAVRFRIDPRTGEEIPVPHKGCVGKKFRPPEIFLKGREYLASKVDSWCLGWSTFYLLFAVEIIESVCLADRDLRWELFVKKEYDQLFAHLGVLHNFSPVARDFVLRLLDPIPHQRMSIAEALQHPFLAAAEHLPVYVHDIPSLRQRFKNYHQNTDKNNNNNNNDTCEARTDLENTTSSRNRFADAKFQESFSTTTASSSSPSSSASSSNSCNSVSSSSSSNSNNSSSNSSSSSSNSSCSSNSSSISSSSSNSSSSGMMRACGISQLRWLTPRVMSNSRKENTTNNSLLKSRKESLPPVIPEVYFSKYQRLYCTSDKPSGVNNNRNTTTTTPSVIPLLPYSASLPNFLPPPPPPPPLPLPPPITTTTTPTTIDPLTTTAPFIPVTTINPFSSPLFNHSPSHHSLTNRPESSAVPASSSIPSPPFHYSLSLIPSSSFSASSNTTNSSRVLPAVIYRVPLPSSFSSRGGAASIEGRRMGRSRTHSPPLTSRVPLHSLPPSSSACSAKFSHPNFPIRACTYTQRDKPFLSTAAAAAAAALNQFPSINQYSGMPSSPSSFLQRPQFTSHHVSHHPTPRLQHSHSVLQPQFSRASGNDAMMNTTSQNNFHPFYFNKMISSPSPFPSSARNHVGGQGGRESISPRNINLSSIYSSNETAAEQSR